MQKGGQEDVVPLVIDKKRVRGTPFITNKEKEVFIEKNDGPNKPADLTSKPLTGTNPNKVPNTNTGPKDEYRYKSKAEYDNFNPNKPPEIKNFGPSIRHPTNIQETQRKFTVEVYEPIEPQAKPQQPMGMYNPYCQYIPPGPALNLFGTTAEDKLKAKAFSAKSFEHLYDPTRAISCGPNVKIPMQQVYNINLPGPTGSHVEMNKIWENILPGGEHKLTATTLGERLQSYDYIRQIIIHMHEGEEISIDSDGKNSIMSYIKLMDLNPNHYNVINSNPYTGLANGLLIYRCCFPIVYEPISQSVVCAKNSIGLNLRLYALTCAEYYSFTFRQSVYIYYDVWRELAYYQYIRENVLKKKQSPNFPLLYSYFLSPNKKIDFFKLKKNSFSQKDILTSEYTKFEKYQSLMLKPDTVQITRPMNSVAGTPGKSPVKLPDEKDPTLQAYSGTTLVLITEATHHNLYQWASRCYEPNGIVRKMISNGYHNEDVWLGILFQIISALYVLQVHGIYIKDMSISDNIFIKDLQNYGKPMGYWKYIINGVSYYVPNYGYIVFIDSNFKDITSTNIIDNCKREYKIYTANIFGNKYSLKDIRRKVFENYRNIISTNSFTKEHTGNNVFRPPESIMKLIGAMMKDNETDLGRVLSKHFQKLMNNRIGTLLRKDSELPNIRELTGNFKEGEMAIEVIEEDVYKWCMINKIKSDGMIEITTRNNPKSSNFITKTVRIETLKQYAQYEKIDQNTTSDLILSEDDLLETYVIDITTEDSC